MKIKICIILEEMLKSEEYSFTEQEQEALYIKYHREGIVTEWTSSFLPLDKDTISRILLKKLIPDFPEVLNQLDLDDWIVSGPIEWDLINGEIMPIIWLN
jgi:hypothetical protein